MIKSVLVSAYSKVIQLYRYICVTYNVSLKYLWLHWVSVATRGPSSAGGLFLLQNTGSGGALASGVALRGLSSCGHRGLSCPAACGIFSDQGSHPHTLELQADS